MPNNNKNIVKQASIKKYSFLNNLWYFFKWLMLGYFIFIISFIGAAYFKLFVFHSGSSFENFIKIMNKNIILSFFSGAQSFSGSYLNDVVSSIFIGGILLGQFTISYLVFIVFKVKKRVNFNMVKEQKSLFLSTYCRITPLIGLLFFDFYASMVFLSSGSRSLYPLHEYLINVFFSSGVLIFLIWPFIKTTNKKIKYISIILAAMVTIIGLTIINYEFM